MKNILIYLIISAVITGCAGGSIGGPDSFPGSDREIITIDGLPVSVAIIKLDEFTFDVSSTQSGFVVARLLVQRDRYRRGAILALKKRLGESKKFSIIDEVFRGDRLFVRFKVTDK
jgi:hypothetical protein